MPKISYIDRRFNSKSKVLIAKANDIIAEYEAAGFTLTLRQLYYQFVARGFLPNKQLEYKRLGSVINDARLAGLIDWNAIEDRTRFLRRHSSWNDPSDIIRQCSEQFQFDVWEDQDQHIEVWIEKDALVGVIEPVCNRWRIPYFACRGYTSQSEQWTAGQRLKRFADQGKECIVLHLGDHDPSGIDMSRDNGSRLDLFTSGDVEIKRLALNLDQVKKYNPPPNPAKQTDSRFEEYSKEYGTQSWELDALDPKTIDELIDKVVSKYVDMDLWEAARRREIRAREILGLVADDWKKLEKRYGEKVVR